jgi:hypothetical protein
LFDVQLQGKEAQAHLLDRLRGQFLQLFQSLFDQVLEVSELAQGFLFLAFVGLVEHALKQHLGVDAPLAPVDLVESPLELGDHHLFELFVG